NNKLIKPCRESEMLQLNDGDELETEHPISDDEAYQTALEEFMLVEEAGDKFDKEKISNGDLTPVFFGSALSTFGIEEFLDTYVDFAPMPTSRKTESGNDVTPTDVLIRGCCLKIDA